MTSSEQCYEDLCTAEHVYSAVTRTSVQLTADDIDCSKTAMSHDDAIISVRLSASVTYDLIIRNGT